MKNQLILRLFAGAFFTFTLAPCLTAGQETSITEFSQKDTNAFNWRIVDDRVMGGRSQGNMLISEDGILTFSGNLSLENNGGFSSVRSGDVRIDMSAAEGVALRVKGDGRTYELHFSTTTRWKNRGITFAGMLPTEKGQWTEIKIPFSVFEADFRGQRVDDKRIEFDPADVREITLELVDKNAGPFELQVDWIRTYGSNTISI